jgi:hypothetical protein
MAADGEEDYSHDQEESCGPLEHGAKRGATGVDLMEGMKTRRGSNLDYLYGVRLRGYVDDGVPPCAIGGLTAASPSPGAASDNPRGNAMRLHGLSPECQGI